MTQQEFVKKEVDKELNGFPNGLVNLPQIGLAFYDGLTKGLEIAEEIIQQLTGEDKERSKLLLNKFLTQKYEE